MQCAVCGKEWECFGSMRLIGFIAGFDGEDHPVVLQARNCTCEGTFSETVDRLVVEAALTVPGKIGISARAAIEDLEMHIREDEESGG